MSGRDQEYGKQSQSYDDGQKKSILCFLSASPALVDGKWHHRTAGALLAIGTRP